MLQRKILIVDDEEHICELIGFNLRKSGYKTIAANDGLSGLKIARREKPDLILLDVMLPELDGYEVCKEIRKDSEISSTPVIMITAREKNLTRCWDLSSGQMII